MYIFSCLVLDIFSSVISPRYHTIVLLDLVLHPQMEVSIFILLAFYTMNTKTAGTLLS